MLGPTSNEIAALREFNRTYTSKLGLLNFRLDGSPFTLSEARVLYELATRSDPTAAELARTLEIDPAQLSRTLKRFSSRGLAETRSDPAHGKHQLLSLTSEGHAAFAALNAGTQDAVGAMLDRLPPLRRRRLLDAANVIREILTAGPQSAPVLRGLEAGDLGLVIQRQAILYAEEYGWNADYEALVAGILADFHRSFDAKRDAAWIAEIDGRMVGSIFLVHGDASDTAALRLLYVEPDARGVGVGSLLVAACIERARDLGFDRLTLWTNDVLTAARVLYERAGFKLIKENPHHSFGHDLIGQTWALDLEERRSKRTAGG